MYCTACGSKVRVGARFCPACGVQVREVVRPGPSVLRVFFAKHGFDVLLGVVLLAFALSFEYAVVPGLVLLFVAWSRNAWYSVGVFLGAVLFLLLWAGTAAFSGGMRTVGEAYTYAVEESSTFYYLFKILTAALLALEFWKFIRAKRKRIALYAAAVVFALLAAIPMYYAVHEWQRLHPLSPEEYAEIEALFPSGTGKVYIVQEVERDLKEELVFGHVGISDNRYGDVTASHSVTYRGTRYSANVHMRYDAVQLPERVGYKSGKSTLHVQYAGPDSLLIWDPSRNPDAPPMLALSETLLSVRAVAQRDLRQATFDRMRDSLHLMQRTFEATVLNGYCNEYCYLTIRESLTGANSEVRCSLLQIPGGQMAVFIEKAIKESTLWSMTTRRTLQATAQQVEQGYWRELEELLTMTPQEPLVEIPAPVIKMEVLEPKRIVDARTLSASSTSNKQPVIDEPAEFPGGSGALSNFIRRNLKYPPEALASGRTGLVVVEILVRADGRISEPKVIRSVSEQLDQEALRIVSLMPDWAPAKSGGRPIASKEQVTIRFTIR